MDEWQYQENTFHRCGSQALASAVVEDRSSRSSSCSVQSEFSRQITRLVCSAPSRAPKKTRLPSHPTVNNTPNTTSNERLVYSLFYSCVLPSTALMHADCAAMDVLARRTHAATIHSTRYFNPSCQRP